MVPVPFVAGMLGQIFLIGKSFILKCKGMSDTYNKDTKLNFSFPHWCEVLMQQHQNGEYNIIIGTTLCFNNRFHLRGQHMHTHTHTKGEKKEVEA